MFETTIFLKDLILGFCVAQNRVLLVVSACARSPRQRTATIQELMCAARAPLICLNCPVRPHYLDGFWRRAFCALEGGVLLHHPCAIRSSALGLPSKSAQAPRRAPSPHVRYFALAAHFLFSCHRRACCKCLWPAANEYARAIGALRPRSLCAVAALGQTLMRCAARRRHSRECALEAPPLP